MLFNFTRNCRRLTVCAATGAIGLLVASVTSPGTAASRVPVDPLLYVSGYVGDDVNIYSQNGHNQVPIGQLTGLSDPIEVYVNKAGDLYVPEDNAGQVPVFHRGATTPFETLSVPLQFVYAATEDSHGAVYVGGGSPSGPATVEVYPAGSLNPTASLTDSNFTQVLGVTIDSKGNLFTCARSARFAPAAIDEFRAGSMSPINLGLRIKSCDAIEIGPGDNLLVADILANAVEVFPPGSTMPSRTLRTNGAPISVSLTADASDVYVGLANNSVSEFNARGQLVDTITNGLTRPAVGVATDPGFFPY